MTNATLTLPRRLMELLRDRFEADMMGDDAKHDPDVTAVYDALVAACTSDAATQPDDNPDDWAFLRWHVSDVAEIRPDLTTDQARDVLRYVKTHHNAEFGVNWDRIEAVAADMFGAAELED